MGWQTQSGREADVERWPAGQAGALRAWDAADEYLLRHLREQPASPGPLLLVDDRWGALAVALDDRQTVVWGDSHLGQLALAANLRRAGRDPQAVPFVPADTEPPGRYGLVLLRLLADLERLDDTLRRLVPRLAAGAVVLAGGMIKHTPTRAWRLLERHLGPTPTVPGWKKARLGIAGPLADPPPASPPAPVCPTYVLPDDGLEFVGAPGVFGGGRLDGGTRLLLRHLPATDAHLAAADLGCGDGVLALALARRCRGATVTGVDESYRAVACARANLARNGAVLGGTAGRVRLVVGDGLDGAPDGTLDLVLCNPPFHQGQAVADITAGRLFAQAHRALRPGGRLLVVGNRHLGHHAKLDRIFGRHELLDGDRRFVVLAADR